MTERVDTIALALLAEAATPGPWELTEHTWESRVNGFSRIGRGDFDMEKVQADARFIASCSPEVVLALIRERDAAETRAAELEKQLLGGGEAARGEAEQRLHLILSVIYTTHGYMRDGEIDTAAKFRAIERLARLDWNEDGTPR